MRVASPRLKFAKKIAASSQRCSTPAIRVATRSHSATATVPQMASAISIGHNISQSMRGCSRLATPYPSERAMLIGAESARVSPGA